MSSFTRLGANLWYWEPWVQLNDPAAQLLWIALYTTAQAKRVVPGLWHGDTHAMAAAARRPHDEILSSLDKLLEHEMVEFDFNHSVLRMTVLPDAGEYPSAPPILSAWFNRFLLVPPCPVRDAHVTVIRWIMDRGAATAARNLSKKPTALHEEMWAKTFGTIPIPASRRRGMKRLLDADTGTSVQPSLFGERPTREPLRLPSGSGPTGEAENKDLRYLESHSSGTGVGVGVGVLDLSFGSGSAISPRPPSGASGTEPTRDHEQRPYPAPTTLRLVPPYTPEQLLAALSAGVGDNRLAVVHESLRASLCATIRELDAQGVGIPEITAAGRWIAHRRGGIAPPPGIHPHEHLCWWAVGPGNIANALVDARQHEDDARARSAMLAEALAGGAL